MQNDATPSGRGHTAPKSPWFWLVVGLVIGVVHGAPIFAAIHAARSTAAPVRNAEIRDRAGERIDGSERHPGGRDQLAQAQADTASGRGPGPEDRSR